MRHLTILAVTLAVSACGLWQQQMPSTLHIESSCTAQEEQEIIKAIETWNRLGRTRLAEPKTIFILGERVSSPYRAAIYGDDLNVVYCLHVWQKEVETMDEAQADPNSHVIGYGTAADIIVLAYRIRELNIGDDGFHEADYLNGFRRVTLHELGHFVGMGHIDEQPAVMNTYVSNLDWFTDYDIGQFCAVYDCRP